MLGTWLDYFLKVFVFSEAVCVDKNSENGVVQELVH